MNYTASMGGRECIANLAGILQHLLKLKRPAESMSFDILHHEIIRPNVVQGADMRMIESGDRTSFALETIGESLLTDLDRNDTMETRVMGLVDFAHSACPDRACDSVRPQRFS